MKKLLSVLLAVVLAIGCFSVIADTNKVVDTRHSIGTNISGFNAANLNGTGNTDGSVLANADITLFNFWSTGCGPCVSEMPDLQEAHEYYTAHPEERVQIFGVIAPGWFGCTESGALAFLNQNGYTYPNLVPDNVLSGVLNSVGAIPQTIVVDSEGNILDHIVGSFPSTQYIYNVVNMWKEALNGGECTLTFVNGVTGETFATQTCPIGTNLDDIEYPAAPEMEGCTFSEWQFSGSGIYETAYSPYVYLAMGDVTVTATYDIQKNKVRFYDGVDGKLLKVQLVVYGQSATAPEHPEHEGYTFTGWDVDFSEVYAPLDVHGVCVSDEQPPETEEPVTPPPAGLPGDVNGDGEVTAADANLAMRMALNIMDVVPAADFNGDGQVTAADANLIMRAALGF